MYRYDLPSGGAQHARRPVDNVYYNIIMYTDAVCTARVYYINFRRETYYCAGGR